MELKQKRASRPSYTSVNAFLIRACPSTAASAQRMYILRSALPPALVERLAEPRPIAFPENIPNDQDNDAGYVRNAVLEDCGAVLDWEKGDGGAAGGGAACIGILFVILGLILVHDRAMKDGEWR